MNETPAIPSVDTLAPPQFLNTTIPQLPTSGFGTGMNPMEASNEFVAESDIVKLPSKGWYYPNKKGELLVQEMFSTDEDILLTPSLVSQGTQYDTLLRQKIQDKDFDVSWLLEGDKQALLLWLRIGGYDHTYETIVTDPFCPDASKATFKTSVDLRLIGYKNMTHQPDEMGYHSMLLPHSGKMVRFRMLSELEAQDIQKRAQALTDMNGGVSPVTTLRYKSQIVDVDGNNNRTYISQFADRMKPKDALALRRFISEVTPGLDLNYEFRNPNTGSTFQAEISPDLQFYFPAYGV